MTFVDSHAHINSEEFQEDRDQVIARAFREEINTILCPADLSEAKNCQIALELERDYPNVIVIAGVHPHNSQNFHPNMEKTMKQLAMGKKMYAVGEIGLDFHYNFSPPEKQIEVFRNQLNIAQGLDLPVVIHSRKAADQIAVSIQEEDFTNGGVLHCFTENWEFAKHMLDQNFLISFSGILTHPNAQSLRDVAEKLPIEKILIETDSPYLVPVPYRGRIKRNEPLYVKEVAKTLADIKKLDLGDIARITSQNFMSLFPFEL
jgi:TatD DNase family protein